MLIIQTYCMFVPVCPQFEFMNLTDLLPVWYTTYVVGGHDNVITFNLLKYSSNSIYHLP